MSNEQIDTASAKIYGLDLPLTNQLDVEISNVGTAVLHSEDGHPAHRQQVSTVSTESTQIVRGSKSRRRADHISWKPGYSTPAGSAGHSNQAISILSFQSTHSALGPEEIVEGGDGQPAKKKRYKS
jgi:hypothetical protein